ncbi:MAG TPA: hypothetical protein VGH54_22070 [Mycobacterium sp.]|uniref:hypothetical protein n=1 Tax=Mycobacterium sp. TaxID=1785 RepID=UPI002F405687
MKTDIGQGKQALQLAGGGLAGYVSTGSITYAATTVTPGTSPAWTVSTSTNFGATNVWTGYVVVAGQTYGVITSNTATALTIDKWYNPANPTGAAATTPTTGSQSFIIVPGNASVFYMALTNTGSFTPVHGDTSLSGEQTSNGLSRQAATFAHTFSTSSTNNTYTLTSTWTYTGSSPVTLTGIGTFDSATSSTGVMFHETALSSSATVSANGDQLTVTQTVTM